jgi:hypothetical protein
MIKPERGGQGKAFDSQDEYAFLDETVPSRGRKDAKVHFMTEHPEAWDAAVSNITNKVWIRVGKAFGKTIDIFEYPYEDLFERFPTVKSTVLTYFDGAVGGEYRDELMDLQEILLEEAFKKAQQQNRE